MFSLFYIFLQYIFFWQSIYKVHSQTVLTDWISSPIIPKTR